MQRKRWTLPVLLGLITAVLLVAVLWPKETPKRTVVVAARDLGAGTALVASDLTTTILEAGQAPADAVADPAKLAGQTLAVVRFTGEPVTPRHLGPAVTLAPDERGIAISVKADTGLAGLLRPGMQVGVVATLAATAEAGREVYAKTTLEGLRVLYVSPDFQARPYTPATASATVTKNSSGGALGTDSTPATSSTGSSGTVREGVLVLAAGTQAQPIRYETTLPLTQTVSADASVTETLKLAAAPAPKGQAATPAKATAANKPEPEPPVRWVVPVELLAALNAQGDSFTLVLLPETPQAYVTAGLSLADLRALETQGEPRR
jgi:Flp pilus assembly protein CpaB